MRDILISLMIYRRKKIKLEELLQKFNLLEKVHKAQPSAGLKEKLK